MDEYVFQTDIRKRSQNREYDNITSAKQLQLQNCLRFVWEQWEFLKKRVHRAIENRDRNSFTDILSRSKPFPIKIENPRPLTARS